MEAFRGMHVSLVKHSYVLLPRKRDYRTDTQTDAGQSDPYVPLCFAGNTKIRHVFLKHRCLRRQQSQTMAKISKSYILTPSHPQGQVMSVKYEQPLDVPYKRKFSRVSNFAILWSKVVSLFSRVQFFANLKMHKMLIPEIWLFKDV